MSCLSESFLSEIPETASGRFLSEVAFPKLFRPKVFDFDVTISLLPEKVWSQDSRFNEPERDLKLSFCFSLEPLSHTRGCPKKIVPRLFFFCGGALDSIISLFTQLHRSGFKLEFETLYESIRQLVADSW